MCADEKMKDPGWLSHQALTLLVLNIEVFIKLCLNMNGGHKKQPRSFVGTRTTKMYFISAWTQE